MTTRNVEPTGRYRADGPAICVKPRIVLGIGVLALLALAAFVFRENLYRPIVGTTEASPIATLAGLVAESGLLVLIATAGILAAWSWLRARHTFWILVLAGVGVVAAYLASEGVKLLVAQERPCQALDVQTVLACPGAGDWSWPSNHSVIAAAFATACIVAVPRTARFVVPVAVTIAFSRVAAGVHYVHDVLSGLALGVLVVVLVTAVLSVLVDRAGGTLRRE